MHSSVSLSSFGISSSYFVSKASTYAGGMDLEISFAVNADATKNCPRGLLDMAMPVIRCKTALAPYTVCRASDNPDPFYTMPILPRKLIIK